MMVSSRLRLNTYGYANYVAIIAESIIPLTASKRQRNRDRVGNSGDMLRRVGVCIVYYTYMNLFEKMQDPRVL